jgi:glycosyltransferase involved in cell wall biosynthesis
VRILVDATSLLLRSAGVKSYTWHWLKSLRRAAPAGSIGAFPRIGDTGARLDHEHSILPAAATWARLAGVFLTNLAGSRALDAACRGYDVFHASNMVRVAPRRARLTATLHDLTCWLMPELHAAGNLQADAYFARHILKQAAALIAVSENTRRDAIRVLGLDPDRITVIYSGIDERFFTAKPLVRERPYVLFLGTIEPRKNLDTLLDAWSLVPESGYDLLIAGPPGWKSEATLARLRSPARGVRYLGYVPESEIPSLTAGASAFVYVSLYEGFGFPVAQAMAAGVPVLTSNTSALPEVAGEGAVCVDPRSPAEIASALTRLFMSPELRASLGAAGRGRAGRYRWDECARQSLAFFERVAGE